MIIGSTAFFFRACGCITPEGDEPPPDVLSTIPYGLYFLLENTLRVEGDWLYGVRRWVPLRGVVWQDEGPLGFPT